MESNGKTISSGEKDYKHLPDFLKNTLDLNKHLHVISSRKSAVILVVASLIATVLVGISDAGTYNDLCKSGIVIMVISLVSSAALILFSVFPRYGNTTNNHMYFNDILKIAQNGNEYYILLSEIDIMEQYANEIFLFSKTLKKEYRFQRLAFIALTGYLPAVILILIGFLK